MARDPDIERRLLNWVRAKAGGGSGGLGYATVNLQAETNSRGYREATIPIDACEADVTDQGVKALSPALRHAVVEYYLRNKSARTIGLAERITERAVHARIEKAHTELRAWFAQRERRAAEEHERLLQLQAAARKR